MGNLPQGAGLRFGLCGGLFPEQEAAETDGSSAAEVEGRAGQRGAGYITAAPACWLSSSAKGPFSPTGLDSGCEGRGLSRTFLPLLGHPGCLESQLLAIFQDPGQMAPPPGSLPGCFALVLFTLRFCVL